MLLAFVGNPGPLPLAHFIGYSIVKTLGVFAIGAGGW